MEAGFVTTTTDYVRREHPDALSALAQSLGACARENVLLSRYSAVGIGGPADLLVVVQNREQILNVIRLTRASGLPWRIFGGLTNLLLPDTGLRGVTIVNHARAVDFSDASYCVKAESGAIVVQMARETVQRGWGGLTWAVGLPGTIGGAVINNAGAFGGDIAGVLKCAEVIVPDGAVQVVDPDWFDFQYRFSRLKGMAATLAGIVPVVVLTTTFRLRPRDGESLQVKAAEYAERRRRTQPPGKTLGSTFKNPPGDYAGRLIEAAGLKGTRCGGMIISEQHANFFMNVDRGTAADYRALIRLAQDEVLQQFGVQLEPEIEIVGEDTCRTK
ncbi:MAG: UDP-N-acetylmuramate dehydrogenase [Anaerolineae bacterium]|nr:UDP-N-acetylmuramate dehydrogenase [Anaerolineae bacterium]